MGMARRRRRWVLAAVAVGVAVVAAVGLLPQRRVVTVASAPDGRTIESLPLPPAGRFEMYFRQSIYDADAYESFVADGDAGFTLVALRSTNQGSWTTTRSRRHPRLGPWIHMVLDRPQHFDRLPVVGTRLGRRTLIVGDRRLPLAGADGSTRHWSSRSSVGPGCSLDWSGRRCTVAGLAWVEAVPARWRDGRGGAAAASAACRPPWLPRGLPAGEDGILVIGRGESIDLDRESSDLDRDGKP